MRETAVERKREECLMHLKKKKKRPNPSKTKIIRLHPCPARSVDTTGVCSTPPSTRDQWVYQVLVIFWGETPGNARDYIFSLFTGWWSCHPQGFHRASAWNSGYPGTRVPGGHNTYTRRISSPTITRDEYWSNACHTVCGVTSLNATVAINLNPNPKLGPSQVFHEK